MKKRWLCLLLAAVMLLGLLPVTAAEGNEASTQLQDFIYQNETYTLAMGHLENAGAVHLFTGGCGMNFSASAPEDVVTPYRVVVSIFQNTDSQNLQECKNLIPLITDVQFTSTGDTAFFGAVSAPTAGQEEYAAYWNAPLSYRVTDGSGVLQATITLQLEEETITKTLAVPYNTTILHSTEIRCSDPATFPATYSGDTPIDTMEELNTLIAGLQLSSSPDEPTTVILAPVAYYGVLDLNNSTGNRNLRIEGSEQYNSELHAGSATVIVGGIRIRKHCEWIQRLYLQKSDNPAHNVYDSQGRSCGILTDGGEGSVVSSCVFEDYDIGLANQDGYIAPRSFLRFHSCGIGVQITSKAYGNFNSIVENCKFTNCGVGMLVEGLPEYMPNYNFRVFNCDFLDNNRDIDSGTGRGYLYFYNNFYGKTNENDEIIFRNAKGGKARILTSPRWKAPVCQESGVDQWVPEVMTGGTVEASLAGVSLLSDSDNTVTVEESIPAEVTTDIVTVRNDLAYQQLTITDPDFYKRTKPLQIQTILDTADGVQELGIWAFSFPQDIPAAVVGTSPNFNPYLEVTAKGAAMTVWVESSDCLPILSPTLNVPCPADWQAVSVSFDGEAVESSFADGAVTFPVEAGGTYTITVTKAAEQLKSANVVIMPDGTLNQGHSEATPHETGLELVCPMGTCRALGVVSSLGYRYLTEADKAQITSSDESVFTVEYAGKTNLGYGAFFICAQGVGSASLQYTDENGNILKFPVHVKAPGSQSVENGDQDFTLGFGSYQDEGQDDPQLLMLQTNDIDNNGGVFALDGEYGDYVPLRMIRVRAGRPAGPGLYDEAEDVAIQVQKIWMEHLEGEEDTFSFSPDSLVTEVSGQNDVQLYAKDGNPGRIRLWATVKIAVNGNDWDMTYTISGRMKFLPHMEADAQYFESLDALEAYLSDPAREWVDKQVYRFYLKPGKHKGTLTMPEGLTGPYLYISGMPNGSTTIEGGIDLNGAGVVDISNISFVSPAGETTRALYNGRCGFVQNCSFYNYDVALESTEAGQIGALTGNLFVSNNTAVHIDIKKANLVGEAWMNKNTFINNETAVQVLSMHVAINPFALRINESNFINNGTDFDLQHPGEYYFYRNYYGDYVEEVTPGRNADKNTLQLDKVLQARSLNSLSKVLKSRPARTELLDSETMAFTNPRWAYPVIKWWHKDVLDEDAVYGGNELVSEMPAAVLMSEETEEEEYVNYLTADWESPTVIINEQADDLQLDTKAFAGADAVDIEVVSVDKSGTATPLGFWTFESEEVALAAADEASGTFHAGVTLTVDQEKAIATVQVHDSAVLQDKQPTFTAPALLNHVQVVGPDGSVQEAVAQNGGLTVQVPCGGTYTVLPCSDLAQFDQDGTPAVLTAAEFDGSKLLVAYYGEHKQFLGMAPIVTADSSKLTPIPTKEGAKFVTVFLVDDMNNTTPLTEALPIQ